MTADSWIPRVAAAALASFADTMSFLGLANGKHQGPEYLPLNPRRPDNSPGSFSINTTSGAWGDFAIGASGLDLVSLAAYLADEKQSDAARRLAQHFGIAVPSRKDGAPQAAGDPGKARAPAAPPKPRQGPQNGAAHSALPPHDFHIGENNHADIGQLPNFRTMAFHVIGKAPMLTPVIHADPIGAGVYSLGALIGDAALKLLRPWPLYGSDAFAADPAQMLILEIADALPLSPVAENVRVSFLCRMGEFLEIALHHPGRLLAIIASIDALTNARLTERARETLMTGIDPGASDLWGEDRPGFATAPAEGARHE